MIFGKCRRSLSIGILPISIAGYNVFYSRPSTAGDVTVTFSGMTNGQVLFVINESQNNGLLTVTNTQAGDTSILANTSRMYIYIDNTDLGYGTKWCGSRS